MASRNRLATIASAELLAEVSEASFHEMAATYAELGPELDRPSGNQRSWTPKGLPV